MVGLPDEEWGEVAAAAVVCSRSSSLQEVREEAKKIMAVYKCPKVVRFVEVAIPCLAPRPCGPLVGQEAVRGARVGNEAGLAVQVLPRNALGKVQKQLVSPMFQTSS